MPDYLVFLTIPLAAFLDRLRGSAKGLPSKTLEAFLYGLVIAYAAQVPQDWTFLAFAALFTLGAAPGWGSPVGAALSDEPMTDFEWWQVGPLKKHVPLALAARGIIWGLPVLILIPWHLDVISVPIAYMVVFPASVYLGRLAKGAMGWETMEYLRGGLVALFIVLALL